MRITSMLTKLDAFVWRGSRPRTADFAAIKAQFATVISLEGSKEDKKESDELSPVRVVSLPILFREIYWTGCGQPYLAAILHAIDYATKPVLVHCEHGEDRTGLVIAAWRVSTGQMSKSQAFSEALAFGYRDYINFGLNRTWKAFDGAHVLL